MNTTTILRASAAFLLLISGALTGCAASASDGESETASETAENELNGSKADPGGRRFRGEETAIADVASPVVPTLEQSAAGRFAGVVASPEASTLRLDETDDAPVPPSAHSNISKLCFPDGVGGFDCAGVAGVHR